MFALEAELLTWRRQYVIQRSRARRLFTTGAIGLASCFPWMGVAPCWSQVPPVEVLSASGAADLSPTPKERGSAKYEIDALVLKAEIPREELEVFALAFVQMVELRKQAKAELAAAISAEDLTPERYLEIRDNRQEVNLSELARYLRAEVTVNRVREQLELDMREAVEGEGMDVERFQEMFLEIEAQPILQDRLQNIWQRPQY